MLDFNFMGELSPELRKVLESENWEELSRRAVELAAGEMNRFRWRGTRKGILPDGYDAESIAAEAVAELFRGNCDLGVRYGREELDREIRRAIHRQIDRLHRRQENRLMRNYGEVDPPNGNGGRRKAGELLCAREALPDEAADQSEEQARLEAFKSLARERLDGDAEVRQVFECFCEGIGKRSAQAARLGITPGRVKNATKRLKRKLSSMGERF
jgi:hypothetical protein